MNPRRPTSSNMYPRGEAQSRFATTLAGILQTKTQANFGTFAADMKVFAARLTRLEANQTLLRVDDGTILASQIRIEDNKPRCRQTFLRLFAQRW